MVGAVAYTMVLLAVREFSPRELRALRLIVPGLLPGPRNAPGAGDDP